MSATVCFGSEIDRRRKAVLDNFRQVVTGIYSRKNEEEKSRNERLRDARRNADRRLRTLGKSPAEADQLVQDVLTEVENEIRSSAPR